MSYKLVRKIGRNHSSRSKYGAGAKPKGITIHHWGSTGQKHNNVVDWLRGYTGNRGSSAHYVVSAGLVTQLVEDNRASWHSGSNRGNGETIGIECRPEMSKGDWDTLVELCADLERKHGSMRYYKHSDWKATACPGKYGSRIGELVKAVNDTLKGKKPAPKPSPAPAKGKVAVDGRLGKETVKALQTYLNRVVKQARLKVDGRMGEATVKALQQWLGAPYKDGIISRQSYPAKSLGNGVVPAVWKHTGKGSKGSQTVKLLQKRVGVPQDGIWYEGTTKALQTFLNAQEG